MQNKFLLHEYRVLSSVKLYISDFSMKKNISFMNILNSIKFLEESHEEPETSYYRRITF